MKALLVAIITAWLPHILCDPTLEDNQLSTDEEVIKDFLGRQSQGQPEEETSLGLPSDEDSFNHLKLFLMADKLHGGKGINSGTHHFVTSSFPEIDARGFHESVFSGVGDYYPVWPRKRSFPDYTNSGHFTNEDFGIFYPYSNMVGTPMGRMKMKSDRERSGTQLRDKRQLPSLVQSCSLPGITCDPITQNSANSDPTTSVPTLELVTHTTPRTDDQTTVNPLIPPKNETSVPVPEQIILKRISKRSMSNKAAHNPLLNSMIPNKKLPSSHGFSVVDKSKLWQQSKILVDIYLVLRQMLAKSMDDALRLTPGIKSSEFLNDFNDYDGFKSRPLLPYSDFSNKFGSRSDGLNVFKRKPEMTSSGFHGDTFSGGFGDFDVMKRKPEMTSSGFHGDTFSGGFGDFDVMKRKPEMTSSGFHGDTFSGGFGDFDVMKRKPEMTSSGFHGDTFSGGFGDFDVMKRKPEMTSSGFHGDTFSGGFGDFDVMKRKPEMTSSGFHGDTFSGGFGDFDIMKRKNAATPFLLQNRKMFGDTRNKNIKKREASQMKFSHLKKLISKRTKQHHKK